MFFPPVWGRDFTNIFLVAIIALNLVNILLSSAYGVYDLTRIASTVLLVIFLICINTGKGKEYFIKSREFEEYLKTTNSRGCNDA
jgi:hypothetical protein